VRNRENGSLKDFKCEGVYEVVLVRSTSWVDRALQRRRAGWLQVGPQSKCVCTDFGGPGVGTGVIRSQLCATCEWAHGCGGTIAGARRVSSTYLHCRTSRLKWTVGMERQMKEDQKTA
jgi:hypothetical protein